MQTSRCYIGYVYLFRLLSCRNLSPNLNLDSITNHSEECFSRCIHVKIQMYKLSRKKGLLLAFDQQPFTSTPRAMCPWELPEGGRWTSFPGRPKLFPGTRGKSAVIASPYIRGTRMKNTRDGITHDYSCKKHVIYDEGYFGEKGKKNPTASQMTSRFFSSPLISNLLQRNNLSRSVSRFLLVFYGRNMYNYHNTDGKILLSEVLYAQDICLSFR